MGVQQLKLPPNSEKPGYPPGFSLLGAGFNPAEKFAPKLIYTLLQKAGSVNSTLLVYYLRLQSKLLVIK